MVITGFHSGKVEITYSLTNSYGMANAKKRQHLFAKCTYLNFFALFIEIFVIFCSETLKRTIYENKKKKNAYASNRWKHKTVKSCLVVLKASIRLRRSKNTGYTGGNEIICVTS
jgi:Ni,Fe-hydrogenase I cytochrome b subunit